MYTMSPQNISAATPNSQMRNATSGKSQLYFTALLCPRHGHCRYLGVKAIVKSNICPKNATSQGSWQVFPLKMFSSQESS